MSTEAQTSPWTAKQAYVLAAVCLLVGIVAGYFAHAPKQDGGPVAPAVGANTAGMPHPNPSPEDLKAASSQAALPVLERLKTEPNNPELLVAAGEMYYHHKAFGEAEGYYKRALDQKDDDAVRNQYASALFYGGKADAALEQYALVLKKNPKNDIALFNSGMICYKAKNDPKSAVAYWQKLLKAVPDHPNRKQVEHMIEKVKQQG